jgi:NhaP-type Na+/H+ or K+/H+ antiporter
VCGKVAAPMELADVLPAMAVIVAAAAVGGPVARVAPLPLAVFLLAVGVAAGPEGVGIIRVGRLQDLTEVVLTLSVALIVFEGGTALRWETLRTLSSTIGRLVVLGLGATTVAATVATHALLGFPWELAAMFGAIVSVTGPSVLTPLLRSLGVGDRLRTTMLGEGVIIDPLAALITLVLLHIAVAPFEHRIDATGWVLGRLAVGVAVGAALALATHAFITRIRDVARREVAIAAVAAAVIAYALAEELAPEAGLTAAVVLGIALGNMPYPHRDALHEFQDAVIGFLLAAVYVLLAASIDLADVAGVLAAGLLVVLLLVAVVRPTVVALATAGSHATREERLFMAAVAPRGVVAASLAAFVATHAGDRLGQDGDELVSLVFVVILMTTGVQSWYARPLARRLGLLPDDAVAVPAAARSGD